MTRTDYDVFLSYAHHDKAAVEPLFEALIAEGLHVCFDATAIETHEAITRSIREGVGRSKVLLAYYSATYPTRRACQWELTAAFLGAQRIGDDPRSRVLVVNPERLEDGGPRTDHIMPVELADARFALADDGMSASDWSAEAKRVAQIVAAHTRRLDDGEEILPQQVVQRLVDTTGFVGRLNDLWAIHSELSAGDAVQVTGSASGEVVQLAGMGGVGKSLLAEEYALRFAAAYPGGVFWLRDADATEPGSSLNKAERDAVRNAQFREVAAFLGIPIKESSATEIRGAIAKAIAAGKRCLWIVDGLTVGLSNEEVRQWLAPHANAKTLITTRSSDYQFGRRVDLARLTSSEGYELLTSHRSPGDDEQEQAAAHAIVEALGGHALALSVTAHALQAVAGLYSFASYREALDERNDDELQFAAELSPELPNGHERSIAATLLRSIAHLKEPGLDLLRVASLLAPAPLSKTLLTEILAQADSLSLRDAQRHVLLGAKQARALSLIEPSRPGSETLSVHTLVARTIRFQEGESHRRVELRAATTIALVPPLVDTLDLTTQEETADLVSHARALIHDVISQAERGVKISTQFPPLVVCVAHYEQARRDFRAAEALWRLTLDVVQFIDRQDEGYMDLVRLAKSELARTLQVLGEEDAEASELLAEVVRSRGDSTAHDPNVIDEKTDLVISLLKNGEVERAIELQDEILDALIDRLGAHHAETLRMQSYVASLRVQFAPDTHLESATAMQFQALEEHRVLCRETHPATLKMKREFALTLRAHGDHAAARAMLEAVVNAYVQRQEHDDPQALLTEYHLADLMADMGDVRAAVKMLQHVAGAANDAFGYETPLARQARIRLEQIAGADEPDQAGAEQREDTSKQVGRNEPCWCGSGVKFKRCHGR